ncbi:uncharacterized protein LOC114582834 isoform X2 [Podarcis muralis]
MSKKIVLNLPALSFTAPPRKGDDEGSLFPATRLPKAGPSLFLEPQPWAIHCAPLLLLGTLLDLRDEDWRKFKGELLRFPVKEGVGRIPKRLLREADARQLRDLLIQYYGEAYAVEVTALVLQAMDYKPPVGSLFVFIRLIRITHLCLLVTLKTLKESDLKKFKDKLSVFPFKEGYVSIPKGLLEEANLWELTELLLTYCAEDYSVEVVSEVLKAIECEPLPEWLFRLIGKAEQPPEKHVSRHRTAVVLSSKIIQGLEELLSSERATKGSLKRYAFFSDEMICKGREQLIEILEEDLDFVLHTLHSCSVITLQEYKNVFKMEKDSKEKIKKLLSIILERGEQACCRFLECLEMSYWFKNKVQVSDQSVLQSESLLFRKETRNQKMEHSEDPGESVMCIQCPSEELPGKIRPEKVWDSQRSHETYRFCFTEAGSFLCCCTDLIFKVRGAVTITYHFDSWTQHLHEWQMIELAVAGPLLNIQADAEEAVAEVHFPHFLCLTGKDSSHVYIAHFVEGKMRLKKPDRVQPYHAVLKAPRFYTCGVIFKKALFKRKIMVHAMALLYQELEISGVPKFHLYLLPNDSSLRKNVYKFEEMWPSRRLPKPSGALKPLKIGSRVFIQNLDGVTVCPEELELQYMEEQFLEISAEFTQDKLNFNLIERSTNELVWEAHVRQEELKFSGPHPEQAPHSESPLYEGEQRSMKMENPVGSGEIITSNWCLSEREGSMKMENSAGSGESVPCGRCPSEDIPEKIKPEVVWDSERGHEAYRVRSTEAGSFQCDDTGLICEVKEAVTLTYYFDSWPKLLAEQNTEELHVAGPLLNFKVDAAEAVASICIPHFLCLEGDDSSHVYIAHFVEGEMRLEKPDRVEPHHAVLENPKFSSLGVVFKKWFKQKINTVVLLYHRLQLETPTFHLYVLPNDPSIIKAVDKREVNSKRIEKPPVTLKPLMIGSQVSLSTPEDVTVNPEELHFQYLDAEKLQQYVELSAEQMQEKFNFYLMKKGTTEVVWKAHLKKNELTSGQMASPIIHPAQGPQFPNSSKVHFIERHRKELIQRTIPVEPVLDSLHGSVLSEEQYQKITAKETNPDKMRELYRLLPSWDLRCKDMLYEALKAQNPHLVKDLEGQ